MVASKKPHDAKFGGNPSRKIRIGGNPDSVYSTTPSWNFHLRDTKGPWAFTRERLENVFWGKILDALSDFESMSWGEILIRSNKQHHAIDLERLNPCAQKRLDQLKLFPDMLVSLRLSNTVRIYGILDVSTLCILWYDDGHGDNDTCVCRSIKKHT